MTDAAPFEASEHQRVVDLVGAYSTSIATTAAERADVARVLGLLGLSADPWARSSPFHLTASALIVHRASHRVLLRWHEHLKMWAHVGGHGDPGETDPVAVCVREGREETGLWDLCPCEMPGRLAAGGLLHLAVVRHPGRTGEPEHEHADLRFLLETDEPEAAREESPTTPVKWLSFTEAISAVGTDTLRLTIERLAALFGH
ncbi:MAG: NUDIX hydrolase [Acidimicrobiales bacterium]